VKSQLAIYTFIVAVGFLGHSSLSMAGSGGENMLLVVNPNDPSSLQIANAYAALRDIPANNILFIAPPPDYQNNGAPISQTEVTSTYLTPISAAIAARGLTNQINYIGTIGQATCYTITAEADTPATTANSLNYALDLLTPLTDGSGLTLQNASYNYDNYGPTSALYQDPTNIPIGDNPAIVHSASYNVNYGTAGNIATQYYLSGTIGYTGTNGNTAAQVIAGLVNGAASDGTRPSGTVYFENSGDAVRSGARLPEWTSYTQPQLQARGISTATQNGVTPQNENNVLGAVCGATTLTLPNGSTYLPGSYADNLTSYGCDFYGGNQTLSTEFIAAGATLTTGSVIEPYCTSVDPPRFTNTSIYTFIADGSTLGEALAKSLPAPDTQMPLGDLLAQPFADVPVVKLTTSPANYGPAVGTISIAGSAGLVNPHIATGISSLELLVDGLVSSANTLAGGSGTFSLNTADLSDGVHEIRVVGINNSAAASEGYTAEEIVVDNHGRSINYNGGNLTLTSSASMIGLVETTGGGTVSQLELTCLGRVVAEAAGSPGSLSLSPIALAPGDNVIVPVAVFSDGMQVDGAAFVAHVETGAVNVWNNGGGTGLWSNPANWSSGVPPQNGDGVARFTAATSGGTVTLDNSVSLQEVDLDPAANIVGAGGYTIAALPGQTLSLATTNGVAAESLVNVLSGSHVISAPLALNAQGNLFNVSAGTDSLTVTGNITGSGALTKTGFGLLLLASSNTYAGTTTISAGTLQVGDGGTGGTLGPAPVVDNALLTFNESSTIKVASPISGVGSLWQMGPGMLILSGTNSYSGDTIVSGGTLVALNSMALSGGGLIVGADAATVFGDADLPGSAGFSGAGATSSAIPASAPSSGLNSVPEPSTLVLGLVSAGCVLWRAWRRGKMRGNIKP
jgi:autotransporter-associated beta strand protein